MNWISCATYWTALKQPPPQKKREREEGNLVKLHSRPLFPLHFRHSPPSPLSPLCFFFLTSSSTISTAQISQKPPVFHLFQLQIHPFYLPTSYQALGVKVGRKTEQNHHVFGGFGRCFGALNAYPCLATQPCFYLLRMFYKLEVIRSPKHPPRVQIYEWAFGSKLRVRIAWVKVRFGSIRAWVSKS